MTAKSLRASELTKELNMSNSLFTQWKKGLQKPSVDAIIKIANYFNVSTDYLLGINTKEKPLQADHKQLISYYDQCDEIDKVRILAYAEAVAENNKREVYKDVDKTVKPLKKVK